MRRMIFYKGSFRKHQTFFNILNIMDNEINNLVDLFNKMTITESDFDWEIINAPANQVWCVIQITVTDQLFFETN